MEIILSVFEPILYVLPFLFVFTILVFFHELGHYISARRNGVGVEIFSIGFGPEIVGWRDKRNTRWRVSCIPLGGYIKMVGDADAVGQTDANAIQDMMPEEFACSIHAQSPWRRIEVAAAGPIANFLVSIIIFTFLFSTIGKKEIHPEIGTVIEGASASRAGIQVGDKIVLVEIKTGPNMGNVEIKNFRDLQHAVNANPHQALDFHVMRNDMPLIIEVVPERAVDKTLDEEVGFLGIMPVTRVYSFGGAFIESLKVTWEFLGRTLVSLGHMIIGEEDSKKLGGLIMMTKYAHDFAASGISSLLEFMAILSLNLGLLNLFPIPMLDGGHILFCLIEIVRGRPVRPKAQDLFYKLGFWSLISLMLYSQWNDIVRFDLLRFFHNLI